jgi:hypothetical protein
VKPANRRAGPEGIFLADVIYLFCSETSLQSMLFLKVFHFVKEISILHRMRITKFVNRPSRRDPAESYRVHCGKNRNGAAVAASIDPKKYKREVKECRTGQNISLI